jgi:hypothetical protein
LFQHPFEGDVILDGSGGLDVLVDVDTSITGEVSVANGGARLVIGDFFDIAGDLHIGGTGGLDVVVGGNTSVAGNVSVEDDGARIDVGSNLFIGGGLVTNGVGDLDIIVGEDALFVDLVKVVGGSAAINVGGNIENEEALEVVGSGLLDVVVGGDALFKGIIATTTGDMFFYVGGGVDLRGDVNAGDEADINFTVTGGAMLMADGIIMSAGNNIYARVLEDIELSQIVAVETVQLFSDDGAILDRLSRSDIQNVQERANITASVGNFFASQGIGEQFSEDIDVELDVLNGWVADTGGIFIQEADDLTIGAHGLANYEQGGIIVITSKSGNIDITDFTIVSISGTAEGVDGIGAAKVGVADAGTVYMFGYFGDYNVFDLSIFTRLVVGTLESTKDDANKVFQDKAQNDAKSVENDVVSEFTDKVSFSFGHDSSAFDSDSNADANGKAEAYQDIVPSMLSKGNRSESPQRMLTSLLKSEEVVRRPLGDVLQ